MKKPTDLQVQNARSDFEKIFNYDAKKDDIAHALAEHRWHDFIMLHERADRVAALHDLMMLHGVVDVGDRWQHFRDVWVDSETITERIDEWSELIRIADEDHQLDDIMSDDDQLLIDMLDFPMRVYRGAIKGKNEHGLSFTRSKQLAEWFARRFADADDAVIIVADVERHQVAFICSERDEDEVVIHPDYIDEVLEESRRIEAL